MKLKNRPGDARAFLPGGPRFTLPAPEEKGAFLFYAVAVALGALAAMGCLLTAFPFPVDPWPLIPLGALLTVLCVGQAMLNRRWKWALSLGLFALWGLLLWRLFPLVYQGAIRVVNFVLQGYSQRLNFTLNPLPLPLGAVTDRQESVTAVFLFLLAPLIWSLSRMLVYRGGALGPFCLTGLLVLVPLGFSILPAAWAIGAILLFWSLLLLAAPSLRAEEGVNSRGRVATEGKRFARPASLLLVPLLALTLLVIYRCWPPETYARPAIATDILEGITRMANLPALFRGGVGSGGNSVDLYALGSRDFSGHTVLQVKYQWAGSQRYPEDSPTWQKDYLKSFVGSVYTGGSWERLSPEDAADLRPLEEDGLRGQTLLSALDRHFLPTKEAVSRCQVTVRKKDADPRSIFSPYGLREPLPDEIGWREDGSLTSSAWLGGPSEYTLQSRALPAEGSWLFTRVQSDVLLRGMASSTLGDAEKAGEASKTIYQQAMATITEDTSAGALDLWALPEEDLTTLSQEQIALVRGTEAYSAFVYRHYTQLPEDTRAFCRQYLSDHGVSPDLPAADRALVVRAVREILSAECRYSLSPAAVPQGEDFVITFLGQSREGFCVHYASAAVALLRAAGIPARYAEGYAVPVRSAPGDSAYDWVDVPDYNAHAWAEVYYGGTGWIPVEVTPAGPDAPAAYANATAPSPGEEILPTPTPRPTPRPRSPLHPEIILTPPPMETPTPAPSPTPDPVQIQEEQTRSAIWNLALGFLALVLPFGILWLQRRIRRTLRAAQFAQPDRNKAALAVYAHLLRLYRANYNLPYGGYEPPEEIRLLALKARFSQHTLTPEELRQMTDLAAQLEARLKEGLTRWPRIKWKWFCALF